MCQGDSTVCGRFQVEEVNTPEKEGWFGLYQQGRRHICIVKLLAQWTILSYSREKDLDLNRGIKVGGGILRVARFTVVLVLTIGFKWHYACPSKKELSSVELEFQSFSEIKPHSFVIFRGFTTHRFLAPLSPPLPRCTTFLSLADINYGRWYLRYTYRQIRVYLPVHLAAIDSIDSYSNSCGVDCTDRRVHSLGLLGWVRP